MKKILVLILSMALCLTIGACGSKRAALADGNSEKSSPSASAEVSETPSESPSEAPSESPANTPAGTTAGTTADAPTGAKTSADQSDGQTEAMYKAYSKALENLVKNHILPDGTDAGDLAGDMDQNQFALYDVDNDGKEELLLMYSTTDMAGMTGYVLDYDTGTKKLHTELSEFPELTFYDNGIIKAGWSHNQGRAGDNFWPYSLYQYDPKTDSYIMAGMVDAWDKNYPGSQDQSEPFPRDVDKSGTGYVYYIMKDGQYDTSHPVDASEYNAWINAYIGKAKEIKIQYMNLTEDNIAKIRNG